MPIKILKIKKSAEFKEINKSEKKFFAKSLILICEKTSEKYFYNEKNSKNAKNFCRIGYTVSKKVGNAVARNKAKRRLRAIVAKLFPEFAKENYDYVIIARKQISEMKFQEIQSDLKFCLKRIHEKK